MPIYTVHEPPPRADTADADPERFVFVRDGFHFWAFLFAPLWMLRYRLWLVLVLYVLVVIAIEAGLWFLSAPAGAKTLINLLLAILVGLEAPTLRRWTLARRGWQTAGVVAANDTDVAERRFFDSWTARRPQAGEPLPPPTFPPAAYPADEVLGLFPQPGVPR